MQAKMVHQFEIPIRWSDMDAFGHVNTAVYFTYLEQTRISWFMNLAPDYKAVESGPVVVSTSCTFLKPILFPETILINLSVSPPGNSSFESFYEIRSLKDPDTLYAQGQAKIVWINLKTTRSTPLPNSLRLALS